MKQIKIPNEQTPREYLVVRMQLIHVKKGIFGLKDEQLTAHTAIPNTPKEAVDLANKIAVLMGKVGVSFPIEEKDKEAS